MKTSWKMKHLFLRSKLLMQGIKFKDIVRWPIRNFVQCMIMSEWKHLTMPMLEFRHKVLCCWAFITSKGKSSLHQIRNGPWHKGLVRFHQLQTVGRFLFCHKFIHVNLKVILCYPHRLFSIELWEGARQAPYICACCGFCMYCAYHVLVQLNCRRYYFYFLPDQAQILLDHFNVLDELWGEISTGFDNRWRISP